MASTSAVSMAMPLTQATQNRQLASSALFRPLPVRSSTVPKPVAKFAVRASLKDRAVTGLTAAASAALTASMIVPDVAEAASGVSPSLKNFLLSIGAGTVVVSAILVAVIGVSNFDPVKRT